MYGYFRNKAAEYNMNEFAMVLQVISVLYYFVEEKFINIGKNSILTNGQCITRTASEVDPVHDYSYGNKYIPSMRKGIYEWTFLIKKDWFNATKLGITTSFAAEQVLDEGNSAYWFSNDKYRNMNKKYSAMVEWEEKDIVVMTLNLEKRLLKTVVNGVLESIAILIKCDPDTSYRMFVTVYTEGDQVELCKYQEK